VAPLDDRQAALIRRIDGRRTLAEIADGIVDGATARALFEALWRLDFISVRLATDGSEEVG
jgi:hypothetical protein